VPPAPNPRSVLDRVRREVERNALRARNGIRMVAGISQPGVGQTPKEVVWRAGRSELWRYRSDHVRVSPPLLIVYSLFNRSYILDLRPGNSVVERLLGAGFDVYLLDWGVPDERDSSNRLGEALLRDHIRDRNDEPHDLVMLAHFVDGTWASLKTIGLSEELGRSEELGSEGSQR